MRSILICFITLYLSAACNSITAESRWGELATLQISRSEINAAVLQDKIVVAGGIGLFRTLKSCEIYDRANNTWVNCPDLPRPLHHIALASNGHSVFACGGYTNLRFAHNDPSSLWRLDLEKNNWVAISETPEPIGEHAMLAFNDHLYVVGGRSKQGDSDSLWRFNLKNNKWRQLASMKHPRHSFAAVLAEGEIWVLGGRSKALGSAIKNTEIYSINDNAWRPGPSMRIGGGGHTAIFRDGRIHVLGGEVFNPNQVLDQYNIFDIHEKKWYSETPPPKPRHGAAAVLLNEELLLIGGATRPAFSTIYSTSRLVQSLQINE